MTNKPNKKNWYSNIDKFSKTAVFFGFKEKPDFVAKPENVKLAEKIIKKTKIIKKEDGPRLTKDLIEILDSYFKETSYQKPATYLSYFFEQTSGHSKNKKMFLEILGDSKSFSIVIIIKTALEILREVPEYKKLKLLINSVGDKDSFNRFSKEFNLYYKKNLNKIAVSCKNNWKNNPFAVLDCSHDQCKKISENAPKPFGFLSENSRRYFKEVLENLEEVGIDYEMNDRLASGKPFASHVIFVIKNQKGEIVAEGGRYGLLAKKMGHRKEVGAIGATLEIPQKEIKPNKNIELPKIFFVQIGHLAKIKGLQIIESLKKINIPTMQSLIKDKISTQLSMAEKNKIPFALIIGQQECLENTVILRDMRTREQHTISVNKLAVEIKKYIK